MDYRESYKVGELLIKQAGHKLFESMDEDERTILRFGMLPHDKTSAAEKALLESCPDLLEDFDMRDIGRIMAVAAMDACNASGKPMVV